jgi:hypothetical protein
MGISSRTSNIKINALISMSPGHKLSKNPENIYYFGYCPWSSTCVKILFIGIGCGSVIRCKEGKFLHQEGLVPDTGE